MFTKTLTPLYEGSSTSMLSTTLLLLNLRTIHGVSNSFMDELFSLLQKELLLGEIRCLQLHMRPLR
jgi:hypothetical protein